MQERVRELELNYQKYLRKKRVKALFLGICLFFILSGAYFGFDFYERKKQLFAKALEEKKSLEKKLEDLKIAQEKNKISKEKMKKELENLKQNEEELKSLNKIQITSISLNIGLLKKAFYENPSYEKALFMSKMYYENKDYKKSVFWALKANELDKSLKESWFLFAKAKEALGEIQEAEQAMQFWEEYYGFLEDKEG